MSSCQTWPDFNPGVVMASHASALVDDVLRALRGDSPEVEQQAERQLERNRDQLLQDLGLARQREIDELRGRIDRLERQMRQGGGAGPAGGGLADTDVSPN